MLVNPVFEAPTAEMRAVLPKQVPMSSAVHNCAMGGSLVRPLQQLADPRQTSEMRAHHCRSPAVTSTESIKQP